MSPSDEQEDIAIRLADCGLSPAEAEKKAHAQVVVEARLRESCQAPAAGAIRLFVPGRIEVLGKHTDYAGGRSLLACVERGFSIVALPRTDDTVSIVDAVSGERACFSLSAELSPTIGHWSNYAMTVARRVARNFPGPLKGADIALASDLPPAAGMSSSSALMIGIFKVLAKVNSLADRALYRDTVTSPEVLAGYLATIENGQSYGRLAGDRGVGTFGGSEDHTAILCCRAGELRVYSFCPPRLERKIAWPADYVLAVGASGVLSEKTGEAMARYNRAARLVSTLLELWQLSTGREDRSLADAMRSSPDAAERLREFASRRPHPEFAAAALVRRLDQFLGESEEIIPVAAEAMTRGAIGEFGPLVDRSQQLSETLLENQVPQTIHLTRSARKLGAAAASAFGAGFGGSVWALVERSRTEEFLAQWSRQYGTEFPAEAQRGCFFQSAAGPGLVEL